MPEETPIDLRLSVVPGSDPDRYQVMIHDDNKQYSPELIVHIALSLLEWVKMSSDCGSESLKKMVDSYTYHLSENPPKRM